MQRSSQPVGKERRPAVVGARGTKNTAPVKRIGAVSPAARDTCRITPVRMPLIELGSTMVRIVCQRVAPMFQQASRNAIGTEASASRVLVMITGRVITASVQEAASSERPMPAKSTKAPTPNRP